MFWVLIDSSFHSATPSLVLWCRMVAANNPNNPAGTIGTGSPPHNKPRCEIEGCDTSFFLGGRHHCRHCSTSVCNDHFIRPLCTNCHAINANAKAHASAAALEAEAQKVAEKLLPPTPTPTLSFFGRCLESCIKEHTAQTVSKEVVRNAVENALKRQANMKG